MSDGLSDYWANRLREEEKAGRPWHASFPPPRPTPIVPRFTVRGGPDIDADAALVWFTPTPPYFWLGKDAE